MNINRLSKLVGICLAFCAVIALAKHLGLFTIDGSADSDPLLRVAAAQNEFPSWPASTIGDTGTIRWTQPGQGSLGGPRAKPSHSSPTASSSAAEIAFSTSGRTFVSKRSSPEAPLPMVISSTSEGIRKKG